MQVYFGEQTHLDQANAIMDSNLEEAWGETKKHPEEWEWKSKYSVCFFAKHSWTHGKPLRLATRSHTCNFPARPVGYMYSSSDWFTVMSVRFVIGRRDSFWLVLRHSIENCSTTQNDWFKKIRTMFSSGTIRKKKTKPHVIHSSFFPVLCVSTCINFELWLVPFFENCQSTSIIYVYGNISSYPFLNFINFESLIHFFFLKTHLIHK